jgi:dipeptidyl aminopeptidase/acylaminoacyl peptidase
LNRVEAAMTSPRWPRNATVVVLAVVALLAGALTDFVGIATASPNNGAVTAGRPGRIAYVDNEGFSPSGPNIWIGSPAQLDWRLTQTTYANRDTAPAWSPAGNRIAFNRGPDLWMMTGTGADRHRIATQALSPSWSPNGKRIAVVRSGALWTLPSSGGSFQRLTTPPGTCKDSNPDWSPLGTVVLFERTCPNKPATWDLVSLSGKKVTTVTHNGAKGPADHPSRVRFMPDGAHVAFTSLCSAVGHCNALYANVMVATLHDSRQLITYKKDPKPGYCNVHDCNTGWDEAVPSPDGKDFIVAFITPSGAQASCLTALHVAFTACSLGGEVYDASWQRVS